MATGAHDGGKRNLGAAYSSHGIAPVPGYLYQWLIMDHYPGRFVRVPGRIRIRERIQMIQKAALGCPRPGPRGFVAANPWSQHSFSRGSMRRRDAKRVDGH